MNRIVMASLIALCAAGCSSGSGSPGGDLSATQRDFATPLDFATPPDLTPPPDLAMPPTAKFVGTWLYGAGATLGTDCPGQPPSTDISANTFTVTLKSGNTINFSAGNTLTCSFDFTVAGDTATIVPGQSCMINVNGLMTTLAPDSGTMVTADGMSGSLMAHAQVAGGICTATISAPATKKM
jgi:hypothetical protein